MGEKEVKEIESSGDQANQQWGLASVQPNIPAMLGECLERI